jgi:transcriptional regulator with XRE-family HTH domain
VLMPDERNWFEKRRDELDLFQREIADRAGLKQESISQYENGAHYPNPSYENFDRIANAYQVSPEKLMRVVSELNKQKNAASPRKG